MLDSGYTAASGYGRGPSVSGDRAKHGIDASSSNIRCLCGSSTETYQMIKCEDPRCQKLQHTECVIIPDKKLSVSPDVFYCQLCRLGRADPFWVTTANPLYPVKMRITHGGSNPVRHVERSFQLTRAHIELLLQQDHEVQVWCMLLNDKVSFRMQWPENVELEVNGVPISAVRDRRVFVPLGINGRDDGAIITHCTGEGSNNISLTASDDRVFCFGVRIVKRRTIQEILDLIPEELEGENLEDAVSRVQRCMGGGGDSDLEIVDGWITVNLRCPMSGSRMKVAGRFKPCLHLGSFDLHVFLKMSQQTRKWQCPQCGKNYSLENIIIDPYFNRITSKMNYCEEEMTDIEIKCDGSWRAKVEPNRRIPGDLGFWHNPDDTITSTSSDWVVPQDLAPDSAVVIIDSDLDDDSDCPIPSGIVKSEQGMTQNLDADSAVVIIDSDLDDDSDCPIPSGIVKSEQGMTQNCVGRGYVPIHLVV